MKFIFHLLDHIFPLLEGYSQLLNKRTMIVNFLEYNNFNFADKGKITIKIQVVYESGPSWKISFYFRISLIIIIMNHALFVEAKEIDILDDFIGNIGKIFRGIYSNIYFFI